MISLKRLWRDRRGNVLAIAAAALPLVIGSAGLASDTIEWTMWKRQLQRAADSAALAGTYAKVEDNATQLPTNAVEYDLDKNHNFYRTGKALPHSGLALSAGFPAVTFPANTASFKDQVHVTLAFQKKLGFSSLFLPNAPTITAEATAATIETGVYCVVSLIPTGATGITATGNSTLNLGCGMITNSTSVNAAIATGSSQVHATPIAAVGNIPASTHWNGAELLPFTVREPDPYANVNVPSFTPCRTAPALSISNPHTTIDRHTDTGVQCVSSMNINGTLVLGSATYVVDGGGISFGSQANVSCSGCTIILTNSTSGTPVTIGQISINGSAQLNMTAPSTGCTANTSACFDGLLFYQDRRASSTASGRNIINGTSTSVLNGGFYFPNQLLEINGNSGLHFTCAQFVAYIVEFSGNGSVNNTCTGGYGGRSIKGKHVRLVA